VGECGQCHVVSICRLLNTDLFTHIHKCSQLCECTAGPVLGIVR